MRRDLDGDGVTTLATQQSGARVLLVALFATLISICCLPVQARRLLDATELRVLGVALSANPASQVVPVNVPGQVNVPLVAAGDPSIVVPVGNLPASMRIRAELSGPGLSSAIQLEATPGANLTIPALAAVGTYHVDNIRLVDGATVLFFAEPRATEILVQDILVTGITSRPLSVDELEARGIVIDERNFTVLNFTVSLGFGAQQVQINVPTIVPTLGGPPVPIPPVFRPIDIGRQADLPPVSSTVGELLEIVPFSLVPEETSVELTHVAAVSGALVFPQAVGFLHQFHSVLLMVTNSAPQSSPLAVRDLMATFHLPDGRLLRVRTNPATTGNAPVPVRVPGPDGQLGTADDLTVIAASVTASSELVTEGLEEGTHVINVDLEGTVTGLASGSAPIRGRASGVVLVRNPAFNLTFLVPSVVEAGREFEYSATITNTSNVVANLVSVFLPRSSVTGATLLTPERQTFDTVAAGESVTARYRLRSLRTGQLLATRFSTAADNLRGQFQVGLAVNEDGVPRSPDTIVLPDVAYKLTQHQSDPDSLVNALVSFLGTAWSNATATPDMLPPGTPQIGKEAVRRAAIQIADAGQRVDLGESTTSSLGHLLLRFAGAEGGSAAFDTVRRNSLRWPEAETAFARAFASEMALTNQAPSGLATEIATAHFYLAPIVMAALDDPAGGVRLVIEDAAMRRLGGVDNEHAIPTGELLRFENRGELGLVAVPSGSYTVAVECVTDTTVGLSLVVPHQPAGGVVGLRRVTFAGVVLEAGQRGEVTFDQSSTTYTLRIGSTEVAGDVTPMASPPLQVLSAWVAPSMDSDHRVLAVLFNRPLQESSGTVPINYRLEGPASRDQAVTSVQLQSSGRFAFLGLQNPIPPTPTTTLRVSGLRDREGNLIATQTVSVSVPTTIDWGTVEGTAYDGQGRTIAGLAVYLSETRRTSFGGDFVTRTVARSTTDGAGRFLFPFVRVSGRAFEVYGYYGPRAERAFVNGRIREDGDRLDLALRFLGRGRIVGRAVNAAGAPFGDVLATATASANSQQDFAQHWTDETGRFHLEGLPVGAVNLSLARATGEVAARSVVISTAGAEVDVGDVLMVGMGNGVVRGRVLGNGLALVGAPVVVSSDAPVDYNWTTWLRTDSDGNYVFPNVPATVDSLITVYALDPATNLECARTTGRLSDAQTLVRNLACTSVAEEGRGIVEGVVLSSGGVPLDGATVYLGNRQTVSAPVTGRFTFSDVRLGGGTVYAMYNNRLSSTGYVLLHDGQTVNVIVRLPALGDLTIHVVANDAQVTGAIVRLAGSVHGCQTIGDQCTLANIGVGGYVVGAVFDQTIGPVTIRRVNTATATLRFDGDAATVTVTLPPLVTVRGVTYERRPDETLQVIGGALVQLTALGADAEGWPTGFDYPAVRSDVVTGAFSFGNIPQSSYTLTATHSLITTSARLSGTLGATNQVELVFPREGQPINVSVLVLGPNGQAIATGLSNLSVVLTDANQRPPRTGENPVEYTGLQPGRFVVDATYSPNPAQLSWTAQQSYSLGSSDVVSIRLLGAGSVSGRVLDGAGNPVVGATVRLRATGAPGQAQERETASLPPNGSFSFLDIRQGPVSVTVSGQLSNGSAVGTVAHGANTDLEVRFSPTATISGVLRHADGVTPAVGVPIVLKEYRNRYDGWITWDGTTACQGGTGCGAAGSFSLGPVPFTAGSGTLYRVYANDPQTGRGALQDFMVTGDRSDLLLRLGAIGSVIGRVVDSDRTTPIVNTTVHLQGGTANPEQNGLSLATQVDPFTGEYRFEGVGEGSFIAWARKPSTVLEARGTGEIRTEGEVAQLELVLEPHASVGGRVFDEFGVPTGSVNIRARGERGFDQSQSSETDGSYAFNLLPLGPYSIDALLEDPVEGKDDIASAAGSLTEDGEVASEDLHLAGFAQVRVTVEPPNANYVVQISHVVNEQRAGAPYIFERVRRGPISIHASLPGSSVQASASTVIPPRQPSEPTYHDVTVHIGEVAAVSGLVLDTNGITPAANAVVELSSGNDFFSLRTASNGTFAVPYVHAEGNLRLDVRTLDSTKRARVRLTWGPNPPDQNFTMVLDSHRPTLSSSNPAQDSTGVPANLPTITLTFSEAMDPPSFAAPTRSLLLNGVPVATVAVNNAIATLTVPGPLVPSRLQTLLVKGSIEDRNGNSIGADTLIRFNTEDTVRPTATLDNPPNAASGVLTETQVRVLFSETMNATSIGDGVALTCDGATVASMSADGNGLRAITPAETLLPPDADCVVQVFGPGQGSPATDLAGNPAQPATFNFRTIDTVDPILSNIVVTNPPDVVDYAERSAVTVGVTVAPATPDVVRVDYFVEGPTLVRRSVGTATNAESIGPFPVTFAMPTMAEVGGSVVTVVAIATDDGGNSSTPMIKPLTISADLPPVVAILQPAAGAQLELGQAITVSVRGDDDSSLTGIRFFVDGLAAAEHSITYNPPVADARTFTESFNTPPDFSTGVIVIHAEATDLGGNTSSTAIAVSLLETEILGLVSLPPPLGGPATGVTVTATGSAGVFTTVTETDGLYNLGLRSGTYTVTFVQDATGRRQTLWGVTVATGDSQTVNAELEGAGQISGVVTLGGQPAEGAEVRLWPSDRTVISASDGSYTFDRVSAGFFNSRARSLVTGFESTYYAGTATGDGFTIVANFALPVPSITSLDHTSAPAGEPWPIVISGANFHSAAIVTLDGQELSPTSIQGWRIEVALPAHDVGTSTIEVRNPDDQFATATFTFSAADYGFVEAVAGLEAYDVEVRDGRIFFATNQGLRVYERSGTSSWTLMGVYAGHFDDLCVLGQWIVATNWSGLYLFEVSDTGAPLFRQMLPLYSYGYGNLLQSGLGNLLAVSFDEAWAFNNEPYAGPRGAVRVKIVNGIFDIQEGPFVGNGGTGGVRRIGDRFLHAGVDSSLTPILRVFDVADTERSALLGARTIEDNGYPLALAVAGDRLITAIDNGAERFIAVIDASDVQDLENPARVLATLNHPNPVADIRLSGGLAYLIDGGAALTAVNIEPPYTGTEVYTAGGSIQAAAIQGTVLYIATSGTGGGMRAFGVLGAARPPRPLTLTRWASPLAGGVSIGIAGMDFVPGATVAIGGVPATDVFVREDGLVATTPGRDLPATGLDVVVQNPDGQTGTLVGAFEYTDEPRLFGFAPVYDAPAGGKPIRLDGINLADGTEVEFGTQTLTVSSGAVPAPAGQVGQSHAVSQGGVPASLAFRTTEHRFDLRHEGPLECAAKVRVTPSTDGAMTVACLGWSNGNYETLEFFELGTDGRMRGYHSLYANLGPCWRMEGGYLFIRGYIYDIDPVPDNLDSPDATIPGFGTGHCSFVGDRVFSNNGCVYSIANPLQPITLGCLGSSLGKFAVNGRYVYELHDNSNDDELRVIDYDTVSNIQVVATLPIHSANDLSGSAVVLAGRAGYLIDNGSLYSMDLANPEAPEFFPHAPGPSQTGFTPDDSASLHDALEVRGKHVYAYGDGDPGTFGWFNRFDFTTLTVAENVGRVPISEAGYYGSAQNTRLVALDVPLDPQVALPNMTVLYDGFVAGDVPTAAELNPASAAPAGGAQIEIFGRGFVGDQRVTFANVDAPNVVVVNDGLMLVTVPAYGGTVPAQVSVQVLNPDGTGSNTLQFTYEN